jgi:hypothetical protein
MSPYSALRNLGDIDAFTYYLRNVLKTYEITSTGIIECLNKPNYNFLKIYFQKPYYTNDVQIENFDYWDILSRSIVRNTFSNSNTIISFLRTYGNLINFNYQITNPFNHTIFGFLLDNNNYETVMYFIRFYNKNIYSNKIDSEFIKTYLYNKHDNGYDNLNVCALSNILNMIQEKYIDEGIIVNRSIIQSINYIVTQKCEPLLNNIYKLIMYIHKYDDYNIFFQKWFGKISIVNLSRLCNIDIMKYAFDNKREEFIENYEKILLLAILDRNLIITKYLFDLPISFNYTKFIHAENDSIIRNLCCSLYNTNKKKCNMIDFLLSLDENKYGKFNLDVCDNIILKIACMNNYKYIVEIILKRINNISSQALNMTINSICNKNNNKIFDIFIQYDFIKKGLLDKSIKYKMIHYADYKSCYKIKKYILNNCEFIG